MRATDTAIIAAWEAFKASHTALDQMDDDLLGTETDEENALWDRVNTSEQIILDTPAATAQGVQCKLMVAMFRLLSPRSDSRALLAGIFEALEAKAGNMDQPLPFVFSAIQSLRAMQSDPFARWNAAMARFDAAKAAADECNRRADAGDASALAQLDGLADAESDRRWDVINTPAPDLAALRWKLDYVLEGDKEGYTQSLNLAHLRQLPADMARLMGEA